MTSQLPEQQETTSMTSQLPDPGSRQAPGADECTDVGNGDRFVRDHGENVRHADGVGWLVWDGRIWKPDPAAKRARELAKKTARAIYREAEAASSRERASKLAQWAGLSQTRQRLDAMLWAAESDPAVAIDASCLDAQPFLLTAANCTIDLRTGSPLPFSRADLITRGSDVEYKPDAGAPRWADFRRWFCQGDRELSAWLQEAFGFTLLGSSALQYWILVYGQGENGKTVLVETLAGLLGPDLAELADPVMLAVARRQGGHSDALARLAGKRMVYMPEVNSKGRWDEALIKNLTGGEPISASFKGQRTFTFRPQMTLWAYGNSMPEFDDQSHGFWRRLRLLEVEQRVPPARKVRDYHRVLLDKEGPGILAWAVAGAVRAAHMLQDGTGELPVPPRVEQATERYRQDQDRVGHFVAAHLQPDKDGYITLASLKGRHDAWLRSGGEPIGESQSAIAREVVAWFTANGERVRVSNLKGTRLLRGARGK